jgi:hypothetical protein
VNLRPWRSWLWWFRDKLEPALDRLMGGRWDGVVWFEVERRQTLIVRPDIRGDRLVAFWWRLPYLWMTGGWNGYDVEERPYRSHGESVWVEVRR